MNSSTFALPYKPHARCQEEPTYLDRSPKTLSYGNEIRVFALRSSFEPEFIFGTVSVAYQISPMKVLQTKVVEDQLSIWDTYTHEHPDGTLSGGVNKRGIDYYNNLINELLRIKPFVTIFHWDILQTSEDEYGGVLNPRIIGHFKDYAKLCYKEFGDQVKHWIRLNEPFTFRRCSAWQNLNCPDKDSATEPYLVTHHLLLAHAAAVTLYKNKYQYNDPKLSFEEALNDTTRIDYHSRHLCYLETAIKHFGTLI
ncbi:cyanogenic beta-glucosidase-like [Pyrus ussuriensis x Pyrus communis]|uniref:Cyanogenic beta-glucosidase-like n=1 Tax=Pyrus ussuriensis x Pyrus communis TaxID=2448454 RepID=A0A5N5FVM8_9ROSA|nr:cyanogenic beta-glucosidase-like [Pyrus ussuriensis x Pyrus communis]